ncbi:NAD(P)H-dependent oxidoreductase, partial [Candidatus Sumerlaeota bacterium]|nr:NAD(P)H-dependent oxidoreductase [Candidatus Sumerlaeota bacterium]
MTKILGVCGCLREGSHSNRLVSLTLDAAKDFGGEVKLLDLRETPLPLLNPDSPSVDSNARKAREMVLWADAFLIGTPDYHGTMSGAAKNFLDYFWHEFTGKLVATMVASHEIGLTVQDH